LDTVLARLPTQDLVQATFGLVRAYDAALGLAAESSAIRLLSGLGYGVLRPVLRDATAIGSLMHRRLKPVIDLLLEQIGVL